MLVCWVALPRQENSVGYPSLLCILPMPSINNRKTGNLVSTRLAAVDGLKISQNGLKWFRFMESWFLQQISGVCMCKITLKMYTKWRHSAEGRKQLSTRARFLSEKHLH